MQHALHIWQKNLQVLCIYMSVAIISASNMFLLGLWDEFWRRHILASASSNCIAHGIGIVFQIKTGLSVAWYPQGFALNSKLPHWRTSHHFVSSSLNSHQGRSFIMHHHYQYCKSLFSKLQRADCTIFSTYFSSSFTKTLCQLKGVFNKHPPKSPGKFWHLGAVHILHDQENICPLDVCQTM